MYRDERKRNIFVTSARGGRALSALQLPWFATVPPKAFGVLTTTGRKSGRPRRRCVRAVRRGDTAYVVAIGGTRSAWFRNIEAHPRVRLRIRGGTFTGLAREPKDASEAGEARTAYCGTVTLFDYLECAMHRDGLPSRTKIEELHREWFETGAPLVVDLSG